MPFQPGYHVPPQRRAYTFQSSGSSTGVLMVHGFMGSPLSSRDMSHYLTQRGVTVHCPLLPGHGHWPDKFYGVSHKQWIAESIEALETIDSLVDEIFLIGHSMGNALCARLLATQSVNFAGFIVLAPTYDVPDRRLRLLRLLRHVMPWFNAHKFSKTQDLVRERILDFDPDFDFDAPDAPEKVAAMARVPTGGIDEMRKVLDQARHFWPRVQVPTLILQGGSDVAVFPGSGQIIYDALGTVDKAVKTYPNGGHEIMRDFAPQHTDVWQRIHHFIRRNAHYLDATDTVDTDHVAVEDAT